MLRLALDNRNRLDYTVCIVMKGKELRLIRQQLGLTQVDLSKLVGVTSNTIARWERGEVSISEPAARLIRSLSKGKKKES